MANFPVFHGITLAANAYVENLNLEILSTDPTPVAAGRVWFNSVEKVVKYSALDSTGAVVVKTISDVDSAAAALETVRASLASDISAEASARQAGDAATLASAGVYTDAALVTAKAYTDAAKAELLGGIPPSVLDTITKLASALQNDPNIVNVIEGMVNTVQSNLDAEVTRATAAEAAITSTATSNYNTLNSAISAETTRATAAEGALDTRVTSLESQTNGKIGNLSDLTLSLIHI